jgi:hypothetical protein
MRNKTIRSNRSSRPTAEAVLSFDEGLPSSRRKTRSGQFLGAQEWSRTEILL